MHHGIFLFQGILTFCKGFQPSTIVVSNLLGATGIEISPCRVYSLASHSQYKQNKAKHERGIVCYSF